MVTLDVMADQVLLDLKVNVECGHLARHRELLVSQVWMACQAHLVKGEGQVNVTYLLKY